MKRVDREARLEPGCRVRVGEKYVEEGMHGATGVAEAVYNLFWLVRFDDGRKWFQVPHVEGDEGCPVWQFLAEELEVLQ